MTLPGFLNVSINIFFNLSLCPSVSVPLLPHFFLNMQNLSGLS